MFPILDSGRGDDVFQLVLNVVSLNSISMFPLWKSFSRSWMICLMDLLPRDVCGVGAKINISKWRSSQQIFLSPELDNLEHGQKDQRSLHQPSLSIHSSAKALHQQLLCKLSVIL